MSATTATTAGPLDAAARAERRAGVARLVAPGVGIAVVGLAVLSGHPWGLLLVAPLAPLLAVLGARAAVVWWSGLPADADARRGYPVAAVLVLAAGVLGSGRTAAPGPAALTALAFLGLSWSRRDSLAAAASLGALLAVSTSDVTGPFVVADGDGSAVARSAALLVVGAVPVGLGLRRRRAQCGGRKSANAVSA